MLCVVFDLKRLAVVIDPDEPGPGARICVGLPDRALLSGYAGFDEIAEADLPHPMSLLMGSEDEFRRLERQLAGVGARGTLLA